MNKIQYISTDFLKPKDAWDNLSMAEKAELMKVAVNNGVTILSDIKQRYNEFAEGGGLNSLPDNWTMEDESAYRQWLNALPDNLKYTDDNVYDMRRAFLSGMEPVLNEDGYYHLGSRDPQTGRILKAPTHPTYLQAIVEDARMGYYPTVDDKGVTYTNTWKGNIFAGGGSVVDDSLVDLIINEEGFNEKPEDIGDGKITLGSGLTNSKWHNLYKEKGNVWSKADNRYAVMSEALDRETWAKAHVPNWRNLPDSAKKALLLYKYNFDFNRTNSPKLFAALEAGNLREAARQMDATSKDPKFRKGLADRRKREQALFLSGIPAVEVAPRDITVQSPTSTAIYNPYVLEQQNTIQLPQYVPAQNEYVRTIELSPEQQRSRQLRERFDQINRFNQIMKLAGIENTAIPAFMPESGITALDGIWDNEYKKGGRIYIKPSHRGRLTELKKRTGKTEAELYRTGSPATRKMITFARSARKWKHGLGGDLNTYNYGNSFGGGGLFGNETVDTVASFLPILGTAEDAYQFYKDPSWANAGWLALSLGSDIFTGGMAARGIKALRMANKAHDAAQVANRAARRTWEAGKAANTAQSGSVRGADMRRMINSVKAAGATRQAAIRRANDALLEAGVATGVDQGLNGFINAAQMDLLPDFGYDNKHGLGGNLYDGTSQSTQKMNIGLNTTNGWRPYTFGEVVSNGERVARQREALEEAMRNFQIESNDATSVAGGRPQNTHLEGKAVRGGAINAAWEKEHPILTAWSYLPSAAVIGTALAPLGAAGWAGLSALGDAAAATSVGQGITNFLAPIATTSYAGATVPQWFDLGLTSGFGAHGLQTAIDEGGVSPMTALEIAPLGRLAKSTWNVGKEAMAEIQSLYNNYPIRNYNIDAILKSDFYNKISEQYGKEIADDLAQRLTSKEFRDYLFGDNPRKAFKDADRHLEQMQFMKDVENAGGLLGGSGQLARVGTVNREGLMHDLDFFVPGSMESKTSPVVDALGLNKHNESLLSVFGPTGVKPKVFNNTMGSVDKGYINLPQERGNVEADMFIRDHMPTEDEAVNIILDAKRQFGRPKDIADIEAFKHYSADNPIIDMATGKGQWNPTLFDEGLFTKEGYPFVQSVETYPGSGVRVPAVMNYKGEIRSLTDRPSTVITAPEITAENAASTMPTGNVTDNLLKWLGVPKERQIEKSALDYLNSRFSPEHQRMAQMLQDNGVDLSKLDARDIKKILDKRFEELRNSGQERLSVARPTGDRHFSVADFVSGKERPVGEMGLEITEDGTALVTDITNYTRNSLTPVKGVQERGLNSAINISKSVGGNGVITGREYQSAPRQYHVVQKFRDRDIVGHDGIHYNSNMVNDYESRMGLPGTYDETVISQNKDIWKGMLELARAGEKERKALYGAPVWRLGTPTFDTPTKSLLFDPRIIDRNGRMIIDWSNPNIFRSFGGHLYTRE